MMNLLSIRNLVVRIVFCLTAILTFQTQAFSAGEVYESSSGYDAANDRIWVNVKRKATDANCWPTALYPFAFVEYRFSTTDSWKSIGSLSQGTSSAQTINNTRSDFVYLNNPIRGYTYQIRVTASSGIAFPCINSGPAGGAGVRTMTVTPSRPDSWLFTDYSVSRQGSKNVLIWKDPGDIPEINEAVDEWYYAISKRKRPDGTTSWSAWSEIKTNLGLGSDFSSPEKYEDNIGSETCYEYEYKLNLFYEKDGLTFYTAKEEVKSLILFLNIPEPKNFIIENEDICDIASRTLKWEVPTSSINPCAALTFKVWRSKIDANGNRINSSIVKIVEDVSGSTYGLALFGTNEVEISTDGNNTVFRFEDDYNLEKNTRYQYEMALYSWKGSTPTYGLANYRSYSGQFPLATVQGELNAPTAGLTYAISGNQITLNWTDEWSNEEKYKIFRNERGLSGDGELLGEVAKDVTTYTYQENTICQEIVLTVKANNSCSNDLTIASIGRSAEDIKILGDLDDTYNDVALLGFKGYQSDYVQLNWTVENNSGSLNKQHLYRKLVGDEQSPELIATVGPGIRQYRDFEVQSNTLHEYFLDGEGTCGSDPLLTNRVQDVGYRAPFGLVSGRVEYEGGISVKDCKISVENSAELNPNKSLYFDGDKDFFIFLDQDRNNEYIFERIREVDLDFMLRDKDRTIEFWLNASEFNQATVLSTGADAADIDGGYFGLVTPSAGNVNWQLLLGGTQKVDFSVDVHPGEWHHYAITYSQDTLKIYVDGSNLDNTGLPMVWNRSLNTNVGEIGHSLFVGVNFLDINEKSFKGYMDEFRCWGLARTEEQIRNNYNSFLQGNEEGLGIYLRMDENAGDYLYDASYTAGYNFNGRNAGMLRSLVPDNHLSFSDVVPSPAQLGNNAVTDEDGNYVVKHISYENNGELFKITPFIPNHKFQPNNRSVFVGSSLPVHNGQDFKDISSFPVSGTVYYGESEDERYCPAEGIFLTVDGNIVVRDGLPVQTDENGEFTINVPIGHHYISLQKSLHSFVEGRYPAVGTFDFQQPVSGLTFVDNTKLIAIGKVVGGTREGDKTTGLGRSKNNIGQATLIFESTLGCYSDTVQTDDNGEYRTEIFPLEYTLRGGADPGNPEIFIASNPTITFESQVVDLSQIQPLQTAADTIFDGNGNVLQVDKVEFNYLKDFVYRSGHSLFVENQDGTEFDKGEDYIVILDQDIRDTVNTDQLDKPVFYKEGIYSANIRLTEIYVNKDQTPFIYDTVGVTDAEITINNGLSGENFSFNINNESGDSLYTFKAGDPNLTTNPLFPEQDYLKTLEITSVIGLEQNTWSIDGYVLGSKQDGTKFTTQGPLVPDHILRDPPGSNSYASISKGSVFNSSFSWFLAGYSDLSLNFIIDAGAEFSTGFGVAIKSEIVGTVSTTSNISLSVGGGHEYSESVELTETINTSSDPSMVGADADLFIGKSMNLDFGVADILQFVDDEDCGGDIPCKTTDTVISTSGKVYRFGRKKGFQINTKGYNTYFIYSQKHIREQLIPDLKALRNFVLDGPDYEKVLTDKNDPRYGTNNDDPVWGALASTTTPMQREPEDFFGPSYNFTRTFAPEEVQVDSVRWYNQQIRIWEEALALNEETKVNAINEQTILDAGNLKELVAAGATKSGKLLEQKVSSLEKNISFSAGSSYSRSITTSNDISQMFTWEMDVSNEFANKMVGKVNGTGVETKHSLTIGLNQKGQSTIGGSYTTEFGFTLEDENIGDFYSVDILDGGNQNGPVFKVRGAETSCPYEGQVLTNYYEPGTQIQPATVRREKPGISISPARQVGIPSDEAAVFTLTLSNSNTDDDMFYTLSQNDISNPYGLALSIDGSNINRPFYIPAGSSITKTLIAKKSPQANDYNDIGLKFGSDCDTTIYETTSFSVSFIPTCSKSALLSPTDQWVLNSAYNDTLPFIMNDYDLNFAGFEKAVFRYKPSTSATWINAFEFFNKDNAGGDTLLLSRSETYTALDWNVKNLRDGIYDLQIKTVCEFGVERFSETYSGKIDRLNPVNFGRPSPLNGVLTADDELSIRFNETINEGLINKNLDIDVRGVLNGTEIAHYTSLGFDGNQLMEIPPVSLTDRAFTLEFFAKRSGTGAEILASQSDWELGFDENDYFYFEINGDRLTGDYPVTNTDWNHMAMVYDRVNKQVYLYINGEGGISGTIAATIASGSESLNISETFVGSMHELRLWSDIRTISEIRSNYLYAQKSNAAGLLGYWPMDEGKGNTAFDKTGRRNASVPNTWSFAHESRSIELNGTDAYFEIEASAMNADAETDFTLSFWFKTAAIANSTLLSMGNTDEASIDYQPTAWSIYADASGKLFVKNYGFILPVNNPSVTDEWHHLALVVNRQGNADVYFDGNVTASINSSNFTTFAGEKVFIGAYGRIELANEVTSDFFAGSIDEVRFWNAAREQKQIQRDAYFRLKGDEPGLLAYYPFEEYADAGFGQLALTETTLDQADKSAIGLFPFDAQLQGGIFTANTAPVKIARPVEAVTFTYVVNNDEIIITPTTAPERIENVILDITVRDIQDLNGNKMSSAVTWTAFVDQNQVKWSDNEHSASIEKGEEYSFDISVDNQGGKVESYTILNLPAWLEVSSGSGTINPQSSHTITFSVLEGLNIGQYEENIVLSTRFGDSEVLTLDLNVTGETPLWSLDPSDFEYTMGVVGQLKINEVFSTDENDMIAAFVGEELRGVSQLDYLPGSGTYRVYLNIYSNMAQGEALNFRIWDASAGVVLEDVEPEMTFVNNALEGTQANPIVFFGGGIQLSSINLQPGWSWISFNVSPQNTDVDSVLAKMYAGNTDLIKGSEHYDQYLNTVGWVGSLSEAGGIDFHESYKLRVEKPGILHVKGAAIDLGATPIDLQIGWNWLGYLGNNILQLDEALSSYNAAEGDVIKGQRSFAIYDPQEGWIGSLYTLEPGKGYMLKASSEGQVIYPERTAFSNTRMTKAYAGFEPEMKESNMSVIAELITSNPEIFEGYPLMARDEHGTLLGVVENLDALYYLTVQGEYATGQISFYLKDPASGDEIPLEEKITFKPDELIGYPSSLKLHLADGVELVSSQGSLLYPNPLGENENLTIQVSSQEAAELNIEIYSVLGVKLAEVYHGQVSSGVNNFSYNTGDLVIGMYTVVITHNGTKEILKFTK